MKRVIVPIDLGGSPINCAVRPPRRPGTSADVCQAMVQHYQAERLQDGGVLEVGFYHGGLPSDVLLEAAGKHPKRVACNPADIDVRAMDWLAHRGVATVELEVFSFDDRVLWRCRRGYTAGDVRLLIRAAQDRGLQVGLTLVPGLPGATDGSDDAHRASGVDFVRVNPVLALQGTDLARWAEAGRWTAPSLEQAVLEVEAMLDILEDSGAAIARVGFQPGPDGPDSVVAGPVHPNFRGLVETRRFRKRMLAAAQQGATTLRVHPKDVSWAKGVSNENVRLVSEHIGTQVTLEVDPQVKRGTVGTT